MASGSNGSRPGTQAIRRALDEHQSGNEATFAKLLGESVAVHLAQMLSQLLPQMPWRPECLFCVMAARKLVASYQVAVTNAVQAGEDVPEQPPPPAVGRAVTWVNVAEQIPGPGGPVPVVTTVPACWEHVPVPGDGPRATGLVAPDGRPILFTGQ